MAGLFAFVIPCFEVNTSQCHNELYTVHVLTGLKLCVVYLSANINMNDIVNDQCSFDSRE